MKKIFKYSMMFAAAMALTFGVASCGSDDPTSSVDSTTTNKYDASLKKTNEEYVDSTVIPTYRKLADYNKELVANVADLSTDAQMEKACESWRSARKYWEFSEAFLFGPATIYSIDPHTDTWPFDEAAFNELLKAHAALTENDKKILDENVATTQNLTGFHAVEYILFRDGKARSASALNNVEKYFVQAAANDLYLASLKLVSSWGGKVTNEEQTILNEAEFDPNATYGTNYGKVFKQANNIIIKTVGEASLQIISGASEIVNEVAESKIGKPTNGKDITYIESPNAQQSIQDFYDNIMSCQHALYGGLDATTPTANSLIQFCLNNETTKAAAQDVQTKLAAALEKVNGMKKPFVKYYQDQTAKDAIKALQDFDESLTNLYTKLRTLYQN